ncbi:alpha/beta-hydrolase [Panus rudis PR-1116 ss-1]|nr:alpha/beta-hydrolase [Panus rudis PR-1116 ss-1]
MLFFRSTLRNGTRIPIRNSRSASTVIPVNLAYDQLVPATGNATKQPLVILHGLFGMKRNWLSLSKAFLKDLNRPIYTLDLRNHGDSPHAEPMTYSAMAEDVLAFLQKHSLENVSLIGHSMGGKVAMAVALNPDLPKDILSKLIVVDMSPAKGPMSPEFQSYIEAMKKIEQSQVTSRQQAQKILMPYESDPSIRAFLLTNLNTHHAHAPLHFKIPVDIIGKAIPEIGSFPYEPGERTWEGKSLFIKGTRSAYLNHKNIPIAKKFFPNMRLEELDAGHWVHAEKPNEFRKLVNDFILSD